MTVKIMLAYFCCLHVSAGLLTLCRTAAKILWTRNGHRVEAHHVTSLSTVLCLCVFSVESACAPHANEENAGPIHIRCAHPAVLSSPIWSLTVTMSMSSCDADPQQSGRWFRGKGIAHRCHDSGKRYRCLPLLHQERQTHDKGMFSPLLPLI